MVNFEKLSISPELAGLLAALKSFEDALDLFSKALARAYGEKQGEEMFLEGINKFYPGQDEILSKINDWLLNKMGEININSL